MGFVGRVEGGDRDLILRAPTTAADRPSRTGYGQGILFKVSGKPQYGCGGDATFGGNRLRTPPLQQQVERSGVN